MVRNKLEKPVEGHVTRARFVTAPSHKLAKPAANGVRVTVADANGYQGNRAIFRVTVRATQTIPREKKRG